jgi:hypothetical protein
MKQDRDRRYAGQWWLPPSRCQKHKLSLDGSSRQTRGRRATSGSKPLSIEPLWNHRENAFTMNPVTFDPAMFRKRLIKGQKPGLNILIFARAGSSA